MKTELIIVLCAIVFCAVIIESFKFFKARVFDKYIRLNVRFGNKNEKNTAKPNQGVIFFDLNSVQGDFLSMYIYSLISHNRKLRFKSFNQLCFPLPVKDNHLPFSVTYTSPANTIFDCSKNCVITIEGYLKSSNGKRKYFRKKIRVLNY